jgi:hypothetical protein
MYEIMRDVHGVTEVLVKDVPTNELGRVLFSLKLEFPAAYAVRVA